MTMLDPTFSVVMPAFNSEITIGESIQSVLDQTYSNFELIIVDDCSNDKTLSIAKKYQDNDSRIKIIKMEKNCGVALARNQAINIAKGTYITFLDSDDIWLSEKLKTQKKYLEEGYDIVYSSYYRFNDNQSKVIIAPEFGEFTKLLKGNFIGNLTGAYNQKKIGKEYQEKTGHEDYLMWLNLTKRTQKIYGIQQPLAKYRIGKNTLSSNKIKSAQWVWNIYRNNLKLPLIKSFYYFIFYAIKAVNKKI